MTKKKGKTQKKKMTPIESLWSWIKTIVGAIIVVMIINGAAIASFVVPTGSMEKTVMTGDFLFVNKFVYGPTTPQVIPIVNIPLPYLKLPGFWEPEKGDVIVFVYPGGREDVEPEEFQYYLKRCVATAGDTLQIINKKLMVNGELQELPEHGQFDPYAAVDPYDKFRTFPKGKGWTKDNYGPIVIPGKDHKIKLSPGNIEAWRIFIMREGHEVRSDGKSVFIDGKKTSEYTVERDYCFGMGDNRDHSSDSRYWGFVPVENVVGSPLIVYWSWDTNLPLAQIFDKIASTRLNRIGTIIK